VDQSALGLVDLQALLPWIVLAAASVLALLAVSFGHRRGAAWWSLGGIAAAWVAVVAAGATAPHQVAGLVTIDGFALFFLGLVLLSGLAVGLLAVGYLRDRATSGGDFWILLPLALLGGGILTAATHLIILFLGIELLSISLYGLIAYLRREALGIEAGLKYLILAGAGSAFLLLGMALLYGETGELGFGPLAARLGGALAGTAPAATPSAATAAASAVIPPGPLPHAGLLAAAGLGLLLVGLGFKLAVVPFHMWTPDVYVGAPAPVTALVATASKGAVVAVMLRFFHGTGLIEAPVVVTVLVVVAVASMLLGNLLALLQANVKRILAYSSIAHLGYLLVAFLAAGRLGPAAVGYYLAAYIVTTLVAFGVVGALERDREAMALADYRGLFWRRPWPALLLTASLLSLAGIPLTAGFIGKYYVLVAGVGRGSWTPVFVLVAGSVIGLFYYLRVIVAMMAGAQEESSAAGGGGALGGTYGGGAPAGGAAGGELPASMPALTGLVLLLLLVLLIGLGLWPAVLQSVLLRTVVGG
jgi:NADH-quinone oxidoreductase subunit N